MFEFNRSAVLAVGIASVALCGVGIAVNNRSTPVPHLAASASAQARAPQFAELVEKIKGAVISVRVKSQDQSETGQNGDESHLDGTPLDRFFRGPDPRGKGGPELRRDAPQMRGPQVQEEGSAFFISPDGYAVTANHVVAKAVKIEVVTDSGEALDAKLVGTDPQADVALLKVGGHLGRDLPYVKFATTQPRIGDWVIAMGNPFGLGGTVTAGIVSGQGRNIGLGPFDDYLQIDAAVNKGNSGGPTFNLDGQVVGVNSAIVSSSPVGGSVGIAFAIPAPTVQKVAAQLKDKGRVVRGWLGVEIQPVTKEIADSLSLTEAKGAIIATPEKGSPAAAAGLKSGDIITSIDAIEIKDARQLSQQIAETAPETEVTVGLLRDGKPETHKIKLGTLPEEADAQAPKVEHSQHSDDALGLTVAPAATVEGLGENKGLAVTDVDPNGHGMELGFVAGDIILQAGGNDVSQPEEFTRAMNEAKASGKRHALLLVKREGKQLFVAVPVATG